MIPEAGTILLVEDSSTDVLLIKRALARLGVINPTQTIADGEEALQYLAGLGRFGDRQRYPLPALVLLDLKLPRQSGLDVLGWLKQQPGLKRTPVVVLTSSAESQDVARAYDLGANSYLVKPVAFDDLQRLLQSVDGYWMRTNYPPGAAR
jgi:CheY-like chemotaxis protein